MTSPTAPHLLVPRIGLTFVDIDHALTTGWPLLGVCAFWGEEGHRAAGRAARDARAELARGTDVEAVVRATCTALATTPPAALAEVASRWWDTFGARPPLRPDVVAALADARADGDRVVLVSTALAPYLTALVGALHPQATVLCSVAEQAPDGRLTGYLAVAMAGTHRHAAMAAVARSAGTALAECRGHGFGRAEAELLAEDPRPRLEPPARLGDSVAA